jgi:DNA helicase-2/ATP-dependent DNA helicase PcrA
MNLAQEVNNTNFLNGLNDMQSAATLHRDGPILVLAGAGSGKTRVLTHRIAHLISNGVRPDNILAVTFTNKATNEMRERLRHMLGSQTERLWVATFHSACLRILRRHAPLLGFTNDFVIYDDADTNGTLKKVLGDKNLENTKEEINLYKRIINSVKNDCFSEKQIEKELSISAAPFTLEIYQAYQAQLRQANAMDFNDLLFNTVCLLQEHPQILEIYQDALHYILVDEFQDTNKVQYRFISLLSKTRRNLFVVGDDDQSIYAFRGADSSHILNFEKDYPDTKVVKLEQNYRSTANILDAANAVIAKNKNRKAKTLWTAAPAGEKIKYYAAHDENMEADYVARKIADLSKSGTDYKNIAIFYRTNAQSRALEEALTNYAIPYRIYGGLKFYDRKEVKDVIAYLRLLINPADNQAFLRIYNTPTRGIGPTALQNIIECAKKFNLSLMAASEMLLDKSKKLADFLELIKKLTKNAKELSIDLLIENVLIESGYKKYITDLKDGSAEARLENLQELQAIAKTTAIQFENSFEALRGFLDRVALSTSDERASSSSLDELKLLAEQAVDTENNSDASSLNKDLNSPSAVSLMTLHIAKGLEFDFVFLTGFEQGLLPHQRSIGNPADLSEERRLCYVGMTRAKKELFLTEARKRSMFSSGGGFGNSGMFRETSQFFYDIPNSFVNKISNSATVRNNQDDLDDSEDYENITSFNYYKQKAAEKITSSNIFAFLKTADNQSSKPILTASHIQASPIEEIVADQRVKHAHFGNGTVVEIVDHPSGQIDKRKVIVYFDQLQANRVLVLSKAGLRII